jgi:hypothetical protein
MEERTKLLMNQLLTRKIDSQQFLSLYFGGTKPTSEYFQSLFQTALSNKDAEGIELGIILINTARIDTHFLNQAFCELLKENWHYKHEDLAFELAKSKDPGTVNCLYEAAESF